MMYCIPAVPSLAFSFSTFLPVSVCPFLLQLPYLKKHRNQTKKRGKKPNKALFSYLSSSLLASPFPFLLLTSLSPPISPHLHLFFLPVSISLPYSPSHPTLALSHSSFFFPTTHTLSLKTEGLAVHLPRPDTYTHPSDQYFFSCYSPLSYFTPPPTSPPTFALPSPPPPCGLLLHTVSCSVHPKSYAPNIYSTFHSYSLHSSLLWLLPIFHSSGPSFSSLLSFFIQKTDQGQRIGRL